MKIELLYSDDCPNVQSTRNALMQAIAECNADLSWDEVILGSKDTPDYMSQYGSPTILINGKDIVEATEEADSSCCRLYLTDTKETSGVPPVKLIVERLKKNLSQEQKFHKREFFPLREVIPTIPLLGTVLIPGLTCPACWPAYAAVIAGAGIGFFNYTPYLFPVALLFLIFALLVIGLKARKQNRYSPFILACFAGLLIVGGRFFWSSAAALYSGICLLVFAGIWQSRKKLNNIKECCSGSCSELTALQKTEK